MSGNASAARQAIATALEGVSGWREVPIPHPLTPEKDRKPQHMTFAVGMVSIAKASKQRTALAVSGVVEVIWWYNVPAGGSIAALDAALDAEESLLVALHGVQRSATPFRLTYQSSDRYADGGMMRGEIFLAVDYTVDLT